MHLQFIPNNPTAALRILACWLGHLTHKNRPEMTYNMFGGTLNPTLLLLVRISGH